MVGKKDLTDDELVSVYKAYVHDGAVQRQDMLKGIMENVDCTLPVAYRILFDHSYLFNFDEKTKTYHLYSSYYFDPKEFRSPPEQGINANAFLDKVVQFVSKKPFPDDFLILVGTLRDQVQDGILEDLDKLCVLLEQKFGDEVRTLCEEGQSIREASGKGTETVVQKANKAEISNISKITEEKEESNVVEMVQTK